MDRMKRTCIVASAIARSHICRLLPPYIAIGYVRGEYPRDNGSGWLLADGTQRATRACALCTFIVQHKAVSRGSSVSIVTDYGLDDRGSIPDRGRGFFFYSLRPDRLWDPSTVQWVPGVLFSGVKRGRGVMLTTHPHLVPRLSMSRSYTSSASMACRRTVLLSVQSKSSVRKVLPFPLRRVW
jgi:hypothetical protein